eukprot:1154114-Pelagomonas_calceolata.AAC.5
MLGGFFGGSKRDKFNFQLELHHLAPFPELPSNRLLTIAWNRGKKRQGRLGGGYTRPFVSVPRWVYILGGRLQVGRVRGRHALIIIPCRLASCDGWEGTHTPCTPWHSLAPFCFTQTPSMLASFTQRPWPLGA